MSNWFGKIGKRITELFGRDTSVEMTEEEKKLQKQRQDYEYLLRHGVETELGYVTLYGKPVIQKAPGSVIKMGKNVTLVSDSRANTAGINHAVIIATYSSDAVVVIGDNVGLSGTSINCVSRCELKEGVMLGANVNVWDTDFHPVAPDKRKAQTSPKEADTAPIIIEKNVWVGANTTILKGVTIGENTVVGTMSLVNKNLPANAICAGIPASKIKDLD